MSSKNKIIIVSGPTATGKTSLSLDLARLFQAEVINFDSLVFYREISIGSARPTKAEISDIPHHLVGTESIFRPLNASEFVKKALPIIHQCHQNTTPVILVGGSGFYLQALLKGMYYAPDMSEEVLNKSEALYLQEGIVPFLKILEQADLQSFQRYHRNDHYRIRRAVEYFWETGTPISQARTEMENKTHPTHVQQFEWDTWHIYLDIPKDQHFAIIQARSQKMLKDGLLSEVQELLNNGANGSEKPLNSIGYKEAIGFIRGDFSSQEEFLERLNINTRRLAKAQRTWFKKVEKNCYNPLIEQEAIINECKTFIES